jgi:hypothetical protein
MAPFPPNLLTCSLRLGFHARHSSPEPLGIAFRHRLALPTHAVRRCVLWSPIALWACWPQEPRWRFWHR